MNIEVTKDEVIISNDSDKAHENEYKITECNFTFDDFTNSFQVKRAIFTVISTGEMYETDIINNKCDIPVEVLKEEYEQVKLGVYGFNIGENDELLNRFSPAYAKFMVPPGSYEEGALSPEIITPTQYDLYSQALQDGLSEVNDKLDEMNEALTEVDNLDIDVNKVGNTATVSITKKDGTEKSVEIYDGLKGEDGVDGQDGRDGQDGYTPQKGIDYFTEQDIEEIEGDILNEVYTKSETDTLLNVITGKELDLKQLSTFDSTKTQVLKNINGTLTWVDE